MVYSADAQSECLIVDLFSDSTNLFTESSRPWCTVRSGGKNWEGVEGGGEKQTNKKTYAVCFLCHG